MASQDHMQSSRSRPRDLGRTLTSLVLLLLSAIAIAWGIKRLPAMARVLEGEGSGDSAKR